MLTVRLEHKQLIDAILKDQLDAHHFEYIEWCGNTLQVDGRHLDNSPFLSDWLMGFKALYNGLYPKQSSLEEWEREQNERLRGGY